MFEIGWTEIMVIAVVAIVVVGPKDLPRLLRTVGRFIGQARRMAGDFQSQFNAALREAEREVDLLETKKNLESINPLSEVKSALDPVRSIGNDIKRDLNQIGAAPMASPTPTASDAPVAAEPLKTGHAADVPASAAPASQPTPVPAPTNGAAASTPPAQPVAAPQPVPPAQPVQAPVIGAPLDLTRTGTAGDGAER